LYITPIQTCQDICKRLQTILELPPRPYILEPSAGTGNWIQPIRDTWPDSILYANEIDQQLFMNLYTKFGQNGICICNHYDFLNDTVHYHSDLIIGNPPYSIGQNFVEKALSGLLLNGYCVFLLSLEFLGTQGRARTIFNGNPNGLGNLKYVIPLGYRPSFTDDGNTDMTNYGVYVWQRDYNGITTLLPHILK
jgi:hypothetical protein